MRVLCSFVGGAGHLLPQLPLHRALAAAGHTLSLVGRASATRTAPDLYQAVIPVPDRRTQISSTIAPLVPVDVEHELEVVETHFLGAGARASSARVRPLLAEADLLVCDELDFGAIAAAQRVGVPVVVVSVIVSGALVRQERLGPALDALRHDVGLMAPVRPSGDFFVVACDPSVRNSDRPTPPNTLWMRPDVGDPPRRDGSIVATLGTEFNTESGDLFDRMLQALAQVDAPSTVAVGRDLDPVRFGRHPEHIHVEQFVNFGALIPRADVVLHHGGSGMFLQSVLGGVPQIAFPMGADQPFTAMRIEALGVGRAIDALAVTADTITETVNAVRQTEGFRSAAAALRTRTLALPDPAAVVEQITARVR